MFSHPIINTMQEMLSSPFITNALWASFFAAIACGIVGTLVIQSRLVFLAGGASHAAYGGIGIAFHWSLPVLPCTIVFSLVASLLMGMFSLKNTNNSKASETAIGVLWAAGMAFGIILIELTPGYAGELMGFLFGSIITVPLQDLLVMAIFDIILLGLLMFFHQGLWAFAIDREYARTKGLPVSALYLLLIGMTAVTVVILIRVVGLILVLALLTIPPYLARKCSNSLYIVMVLSAVLSFTFSITGLTISWLTDISSGAAIIAVAASVYFAAHIPLVCRPR